MAISTPAYDTTNEFGAALCREVSMLLTGQSSVARTALNSAITNPIAAVTSSNVFGVTAGGVARIFTLTTSLTETPGATVNSGVYVD